MIKVGLGGVVVVENVITHTLFVFENSKNTRNELPRPVMGTIFLAFIKFCRHSY